MKKFKIFLLKNQVNPKKICKLEKIQLKESMYRTVMKFQYLAMMKFKHKLIQVPQIELLDKQT
jgi:hypothetical protein